MSHLVRLTRHGRGWLVGPSRPVGGAHGPGGVGESAELVGRTARARVLVMDDDTVMLRSTSRLLRMLGYQADTATDGEQAVERYRLALASGAPYQLVILDLSVGGARVGGAEALEQLRALDPAVRAVVSSGDLDDVALAEHLARGFTAGLKKPYDRAALEALLNRVLWPG